MFLTPDSDAQTVAAKAVRSPVNPEELAEWTIGRSRRMTLNRSRSCDLDRSLGPI